MSKIDHTEETKKSVQAHLMKVLLKAVHDFDADKDTKKRRRKDSEASSSKKGKDQDESSKEDKAPSEPSKTKKFMHAKESIQDDAIDIDWANPEGERCPYDLSKPLPLQDSPGHKTIHVDFIFNKDFEYLKIGNKEKKYAISLTKLKATRYDLEGLKEMIPKLWSLSKVQYDLNTALGIHH
nr:hypothetical protein [Tanacetum cinerariifolium]